MAIIYEEDWAAGPSDFETVYYWEADVEGVDALYPFMWVSEGTYINPVSNILDSNPAWTGPFQDYQSAGIWVSNMGTLNVDGTPGGGYWDANQGILEAIWVPNATALAEHGGTNYCPLAFIVTHAGFG